MGKTARPRAIGNNNGHFESSMESGKFHVTRVENSAARMCTVHLQHRELNTVLEIPSVERDFFSQRYPEVYKDFAY